MTNNVKVIKVKASTEYDVLIGENLIQECGTHVSRVIKPCKIALITDDVVDNLYSAKVIASLQNSGFNVIKFVFPNGEKSKNLTTYGEILNFMAQNELTRTDAVVALGGGVVGDMAGFASATFMRGIKYIQIPTTLLAQVDSSVGGKTAVDLPSGKNLVGAFKQPELVVCDTSVFKTLPKQIFSDGMGEVAKYAMLDKKVFDLINDGHYSMNELVYLCVDYKRQIVENDEFEQANRKLLNLGHTVGHGIESLSNYTVSHGRAVALGLRAMLNASLKHALVDQSTYQKAIYLINKCVSEQQNPYELKDVCHAMLNDKKRSGDYISLVVIHGVGDCRIQKIKTDEIAEYLS